MNKKHFHIKCLKPQELTKYGFEETERSYIYKAQSKRWKIEVWKANAKQRVENKMVFDFGMPPMTIEVLMLFANLLKDNVIECVVETDEEIKERKIQKLEEELRQLKKENEL